MSDWSSIPQYVENPDGDLWLTNFLYNFNESTPTTELKENGSKKPDTESREIECIPVGNPKKTKTKKVKTPEISKDSLNHDNWLGYIIAVFINETTTQSIECCPGCKDSKNSPLFHSHQHTGLLEKLYLFAPSVRAMLISKLPMLVADYVSKYPDQEIYDDAGRRVLTNIGRTFICQCNPTFVYYSKYLTPSVDKVVTTTPIVKSQPMTLKRVANAVEKKTVTSKKMKTQ